MVHGRHGIHGQVARLLAEGEVNQEFEHAHNLLQPMEVLHAREVKLKHSHATPISAKVLTNIVFIVDFYTLHFLKIYFKPESI